MKIQSKIALGIGSGLIGELVIILLNRWFLQLGLVESSLKTMSLQAVKCRKLIPLTTKRDIYLSYGMSTLFCTSGGLFITCILSKSKDLHLLKGFVLGAIGGLIPNLFQRLKLIRNFKKPRGKAACLMSHGIFGLTVAFVVKGVFVKWCW